MLLAIYLRSNHVKAVVPLICSQLLALKASKIRNPAQGECKHTIVIM